MNSEPSFYEVVGKRRSVRDFSGAAVEFDKLGRIMEVGRMSASAANRQPWRFLLLLGDERQAFGELIRERFRSAPAVIVACARPKEAWVRRHDGRNYAWVDVAIAVTEMALAATAEGLGSCWVASFDPEAARTVLGLDEEWEPVTALVLGYASADGAAAEKKRKDLRDVWDVRGSGREPE
jgi:nitroreductase